MLVAEYLPALHRRRPRGRAPASRKALADAWPHSRPAPSKPLAPARGRLAAPTDSDALLSLSDAATLGGLRAFGDRLAVRQRFHDDDDPSPSSAGGTTGSRRSSPPWNRRASMRSASRWLAGIAKNLLAHPGAEHDGLRWLAFEAFSGRPAPPSKAELAAAVRSGVAAATARRLATPRERAGRSAALCRSRGPVGARGRALMFRRPAPRMRTGTASRCRAATWRSVNCRNAATRARRLRPSRRSGARRRTLGRRDR